ncbi:MAG: hypothetical protein KF819_17170 [Labilithrix sp.]|nr:hypothetical protein [Labilithrix sp.]
MNRSIAFAALSLTAACGSPRAHVSAAAKPAAEGPPAPTALPIAVLDRRAWDQVAQERIRPACDARALPPKMDTEALLAAKKVIADWMDFKKSARPTTDVYSVGMTCGPTKNTVEVNGYEHPFDIAWVVSGERSGGVDDGGSFALIQALSFADEKLVVVKVVHPAGASKASDDTVLIADLSALLRGMTPGEPLVHNVGASGEPELETFVSEKGKGNKTGFYTVAPTQTDRSRARYLGAGKFETEE